MCCCCLLRRLHVLANRQSPSSTLPPTPLHLRYVGTFDASACCIWQFSEAPTTPATPVYNPPGTPGAAFVARRHGRSHLHPPRAPPTSGGAGGAGDDSDNEDEVPDYLRLLSSLQPRAPQVLPRHRHPQTRREGL
ncbi:hypothetical protein L1887_48189 [Cichorium endivia]|nr:hypothetical protein L1887_48189 [Cichorium endivia]